MKRFLALVAVFLLSVNACYAGSSGASGGGGGGSGTVTSVTYTGDGVILSATPTSAVTTSGSLTPVLNTVTANYGLFGPTTGSPATPTYRALVAADIPSLSSVYVPVARTVTAGTGLSGGGALSGNITLTNTGLLSLSGGSAVSNQFVTAVTQSSGAVTVTLAQPSFSNISGSVAASQLPNPSASTLGGIQSYAAVTNQWIRSISTSGVPASSQPAFSDISGTATTSQLPANQTQLTGTGALTSGSLASGFTAVTVPLGGTGATSLTAHGVLVGNGTSAVAATSAGTSGYVLTSNGASADPTFQAASGALPQGFTGNPAKRQMQWNPNLVGGSSISAVGANTVTVTGFNTAAAITNGYLQFGLITAATTGQTAGINMGSGVTAYALLPSYTVVTTPVTTATVRYWYGLFSATPSGTDSPGSGSAISGAGFRFSTSASDTNIQCVTANATTQTVTDSGVALAANTLYLLGIDMTNASSIKFYINGNLVATNTTNLPVAATTLLVTNIQTTLANSAASFNIGKINAESF